ncbi:MAG: hydroxymethylbilane synthase [Burkholderiales bacterium]
MSAHLPSSLTIATRKSRLALWQAEHVKARLEQLYPGLTVTLAPMSTRGDEVLDRSLSKIGGKGLFVKELENAIATGTADLAVHSCKDVPMELPPGFVLAAFLEREDPRDAFLSVRFAHPDALPAGAVVGTSSLRREAQLRTRWPHLVVKPLRGNVETRIAQLDRGDFDAIILASAGLKRLGLTDRIRCALEPAVSLPAAGQGALVIEIAEGRPELVRVLAGLNHHASAACVRAERAVSRALGGSCQIPLAAYATLSGTTLDLAGLVASPDGQAVVHAQASGPADAPEALGEALAATLLARGAGAILEELNG